MLEIESLVVSYSRIQFGKS